MLAPKFKHIKKSLDAGMNNHLAKPIEVEKLYECLLEYIK